MSDTDKPGPPRSGPIVIDLGESTAAPDVGAAPPVDPDAPPQGRAMQGAIARMGDGFSARTKAFWSAALGFLALVLGLAAWDFTMALLVRFPALGWLAAVLLAVLGVA
ncbi:hypothetical protein, partial [Falsiroseomonas sp.]|uniref:hypothetical protein n=1 Tax=Falsiroseomonas sp. TaxID=2870721 RepID=UPI002715D9F0